MDNFEIIEHYLERTGYGRLELRAALIDMDGTLYDSMPHHADAWKQMADEAGIDSVRDEFFLYEGRTGASTIDILFNRQLGRDATPQEKARLYARKSELFAAMPEVSVMPGAKSLMLCLMRAGIKRVLVTGSGQNTLLLRLDKDFPEIFRPELRITAHNTQRGKPHPDPYLRAMELAGVQPWQSIAFENAPLGVESASRSGAFTVAIATGPIPMAALAEAGADIVYPSMPKCAELFPSLMRSIYQR